MDWCRVSIPFKRESLSKVMMPRRWSGLRWKSFNSLQTGKPIQSQNEVSILEWRVWVFQFPSNGKAYPKRANQLINSAFGSPFQFPSNGKAYPKEFSKATNIYKSLFQFPSNGKAYPKLVNAEKGSKVHRITFQFPSNGKAYPKWCSKNCSERGYNVSIPFKRESLSKAREEVIIKNLKKVSIPFKRESLSKVIIVMVVCAFGIQ